MLPITLRRVEKMPNCELVTEPCFSSVTFLPTDIDVVTAQSTKTTNSKINIRLFFIVDNNCTDPFDCNSLLYSQQNVPMKK